MRAYLETFFSALSSGLSAFRPVLIVCLCFLSFLRFSAFEDNLILATSLFSFLAAVVVCFIPSRIVPVVAFTVSTLLFLFYFNMCVKIFFFVAPGPAISPSSMPTLQPYFYHETYSWLSSLGIHYHAALDGISLVFVVLSLFVLALCILASWVSCSTFVAYYYSLFLILHTLLIHVFTQHNFFLFFFFFEAVLIPMFLLIGVWGSRLQRVGAAYRFFLYTLLFSSFMLAALFYLQSVCGTLDWFSLFESLNSSRSPVSVMEARVIWFLCFLGFAVKIPIVPVHTWLPEAHVEAPTAGSMLLAGVLLKMGGYGMFRFLLPLFPEASHFFSPFVTMLCLLSILYGSLCALVHVDIKKIVAYSSVAHMGYSTLGFFTGSSAGILGALAGMVSHGFVSTALFFCVGVLYERYGTRNINHFSLLASVYPVFIVFFFFFCLANTGFPGTSSFVGEILVLIGLASFNLFSLLVAATSVFFSAAYSLWLFNRLAFAVESVDQRPVKFFADVGSRELFILIALAIPVLFFGLFPFSLVSMLEPSTAVYQLILSRFF